MTNSNLVTLPGRVKNEALIVSSFDFIRGGQWLSVEMDKRNSRVNNSM